MGKKRSQSRFWGWGTPAPDFRILVPGRVDFWVITLADIFTRNFVRRQFRRRGGGAGWDTTPAPERPTNGLKIPRGSISGVGPVASSGAALWVWAHFWAKCGYCEGHFSEKWVRTQSAPNRSPIIQNRGNAFCGPARGQSSIFGDREIFWSGLKMFGRAVGPPAPLISMQNRGAGGHGGFPRIFRPVQKIFRPSKIEL